MCWGKGARKPRQVNAVECHGALENVTWSQPYAFPLKSPFTLSPDRRRHRQSAQIPELPVSSGPTNHCHPALSGFLWGAQFCHLRLVIVWQMPRLLGGCLSPVVHEVVCRLEKTHRRLWARTNGRCPCQSNTDPGKRKPEKEAYLS